MAPEHLAAICTAHFCKKEFFLKHQQSSEDLLWRELGEANAWTAEEAQRARDWVALNLAILSENDVLYWGHKDYPESLLRLHDPPLFLHFKGERSLLKRESVAVIGSRHLAPVFDQWMDHEFGLFVSQFSGAIVSGGARGADQKASRVALRHQKETLLVIPSGLSSLYPKELQSLWNCKGVGFLSEYLPLQDMRKYHFHQRNRLVAALSHHLFVVHCAEKSGTMITVRHALDISTNVAVMPDFPGRYESSGNLKLLKEGAFLISNHQDLLDFIT